MKRLRGLCLVLICMVPALLTGCCGWDPCLFACPPCETPKFHYCDPCCPKPDEKCLPCPEGSEHCWGCWR